MLFKYTLKSHYDIGYNNFFDTFRFEYELLYRMYDDVDMLDKLINHHLKPYNAFLQRQPNDNNLFFQSEQDFQRFILTWT